MEKFVWHEHDKGILSSEKRVYNLINMYHNYVTFPYYRIELYILLLSPCLVLFFILDRPSPLSYTNTGIHSISVWRQSASVLIQKLFAQCGPEDNSNLW